MKKFEDLLADQIKEVLDLINSYVRQWYKLKETKKGIVGFAGINEKTSEPTVVSFDYENEKISLDYYYIDADSLLSEKSCRNYIALKTSIKIAILKKIEEFGVDIDSYTFNF